MKKGMIFLFLIVTSLLFSKSFQLLNFTLVESNFYAELNPVLDDDQSYCSAILIDCPKASEVSFKQKVFKKSKTNDGIYLFISEKEKALDLVAPGFDLFHIDIREELNGKSLSAGKVYELRLDVRNETIVKINVEPKDAMIIINDKVIKDKIYLLPGKYDLIIMKDGYESIKKQITVSTENLNFNFQMKEKTNSQSLNQESNETVVSNNQAVEEKVNLKVVEDFEFGVVNALYQENQLIIQAFIQNKSNDRNIIVTGNTYFIDNEGNKYKVDKQVIGNIKSNYNNDVYIELISGIDAKYLMKFKNISKKPNSIAKLVIEFKIEREIFIVTFRNIDVK